MGSMPMSRSWNRSATWWNILSLTSRPAGILCMSAKPQEGPLVLSLLSCSAVCAMMLVLGPDAEQGMRQT